MKVKKFDNLWTMGLVLCCGILVVVYIAKLFFPNFVVGVAQTKSIVKVGEYIDNHIWTYYLFNVLNSFLVLWLFCCASCRKKNLRYYELIIIFSSIVVSLLIEKFLPFQSLNFNICGYIFLPLIFNAISKIKDYRVYYSTSICFLVTMFSQVISLEIREISTLISCFNTATYFILLIDGTIWNVFLYLYFNKGDVKNG